VAEERIELVYATVLQEVGKVRWRTGMRLIDSKSSKMPRHERRSVTASLQYSCHRQASVYASPAWWGYTTAADKQRVEAFIRRGVRLGLYRADDATTTQLTDKNDDNLFCSLYLPMDSTYSNRCFLTRQIINAISEIVIITCLKLLKLMQGVSLSWFTDIC